MYAPGRVRCGMIAVAKQGSQKDDYDEHKTSEKAPVVIDDGSKIF